MKRVIAEARRQGVRLAYGSLPPSQRAAYLDDSDLILINDKLDPIQAAESGAHELGHHRYGDRCSTAASEERAWIYAAKILIRFEDYYRAEMNDPHLASIARDLSTTQRIVELYQLNHLQAQAMAAPRNIFGEYEDNGEDPDSALRHSLQRPRQFRCGLAS